MLLLRNEYNLVSIFYDPKGWRHDHGPPISEGHGKSMLDLLIIINLVFSQNIWQLHSADWVLLWHWSKVTVMTYFYLDIVHALCFGPRFCIFQCRGCYHKVPKLLVSFIVRLDYGVLSQQEYKNTSWKLMGTLLKIVSLGTVVTEVTVVI